METTVPAHINAPPKIELKQSLVNESRIGAFCKDELICKDSEFGPFIGKIIYDKHSDKVDQKFSWEVYDLESFKFLHTVDATNPSDGNWMRYVCCARFFEEQNIVSTQNGTDVYYRALKDIKPGEELLTWFQPKKKRKKSSIRDSRESTDSMISAEVKKDAVPEDTELGTGKRKRKPKIIPDSYQGPLDFKATKKTKKFDDDEFEPLQPGQKRRRRRKLMSVNEEAKSSLPGVTGPPELGTEVSTEQEIKSEDLIEKPADVENEDKEEIETETGQRQRTRRKDIDAINQSVDWTFPTKEQEYNFKVKKQHTRILSRGRKAYKCDICMGLYKQMFSLKKHYLQNHINYKYLSKADIGMCLINLAYVKKMLYERSLLNQWKRKDNEIEKKEEVLSTDSFFQKLDKTVPQPGLNEDSQQETDGQKSLTSFECYDLNNRIKKEVVDSEIDRTENLMLPEIMKSKVKSEINDECHNKLTEDQQVFNMNTLANNGGGIHDRSDEPSAAKENVELNGVNSNSDGASNNQRTSDQNTREDHLTQTVTDTKKKSKNEEPEEILNKTEGISDSLSKNVQDKFEGKTESGGALDDTERRINGDNPVVYTEDEHGNPVMPELYRCYTCFAVFDTVKEIRDHLEDHPSEALCFECDKCNMRFHFKQNLARHQKVHEKEDTEVKKKVKKVWAKTMGDDSKLRKKKKKNKQKQEKKVESSAPTIEPKGTSDNLFKCNKCKTIFPTQRVLTSHVQTEHKDGGKFQCQYCGKDFPSMPNMKKHVRFHLGYRVRCRVCNEIFSNVGALRKHTRLVHPEIYKAKRLDKLSKDGPTKLQEKKCLKKEGGSVEEQASEDSVKVETDKTESVKETAETVKEELKSGEDFLLETDITFEAHEIDDGGSRFKFSCTVCKKRFSSYINMCRHRRKVHNSENKQKLEEGLIFTRKSKTSTPPVVEDRKELEQFYANVAHNIAVNLNCFIDGKQESLENYTDHIIVDDYKAGTFGYSEVAPNTTDILWEQYNFPAQFKPVLTVPFGDCKADFSVKSDTGKGSSLASDEDIAVIVNDRLCNSDNIVECATGESPDSHNSEQSKEIAESAEQEMGKPSTGIKALASAGFSAVQKIAKSLENLAGDSVKEESVASYVCDKVQTSRLSPPCKSFCQVKNGEYANFDDLMLGDDFSTITRDEEGPRRSRAHSSASSRMLNKKVKYRRSHSAGDLIDTEPVQDSDINKEAIEDLNTSSQAELNDLYDDLDTGVECWTQNKLTSPSSLSELCERMLGLHASARKNNTSTRVDCEETKVEDESHLLSQLSLSTNKDTDYNGSKRTKQEPTPDYSDAPIDSPFYNYDSIAFGKNGEISKVCAVCKTHFADFDSFICHHWKRHPSSAFNYLEVEDGNDIESLHFAHPSNVGVLAVTDPGLDGVHDIPAFTCTRCGNAFRSKARLHVHIVNCSPIDPVYGAIKASSSPVKSPLKKKLQQRIQGYSNDGKDPTVNSPKRVFSGCRKRLAMLLQDSPIKLSEKNVLDLMSGYNPNKHIRRREFTELNDTLTCGACRQKFRTIILLERHVKNCAEKEKFKNVHPLTCPIMDESLAKIKNICFYCDKNFTYAKSLMNHFQDFCPVKKMKVDQGSLTNEDTAKEKEIMERLQKQEENKVSRDKEVDGQRKKSWQVGRKPKRKGHSWTYIKKRKQTSVSSINSLQGNELEEGESYPGENDSDESSTNGSIKSGDKTPETEEFQGDEGTHVPKPHDANGNFVLKERQSMIENSAPGYDEVDSFSFSKREPILENGASLIPDLRNTNQEGSQFWSSNSDCKEMVESVVIKKDENVEKDTECEREEMMNNLEMVGSWDRDANTSLDFTSRYKVNHTMPPKKEVSKKPLFLQCVTSHEHSKSTAQLISEKVERSKRKRERCGKVEAFLQNVFKRKKKKELMIQGRPDEAATENDRSTQENVKLLELKVLETNDKGNTLLDFQNILPKTKSAVEHNGSDVLTHVSTDFSKQDEDKKHEIHMKNTSEGRTEYEIGVKIISEGRIEMKTEESGNVRYLFKRGRPRKYNIVGNEAQLQNKTKSVKVRKVKGKSPKVKEAEKDPDGTKDQKSPFGIGRPRKYISGNNMEECSSVQLLHNDKSGEQIKNHIETGVSSKSESAGEVYENGVHLTSADELINTNFSEKSNVVKESKTQQMINKGGESELGLGITMDNRESICAEVKCDSLATNDDVKPESEIKTKICEKNLLLGTDSVEKTEHINEINQEITTYKPKEEKSEATKENKVNSYSKCETNNDEKQIKSEDSIPLSQNTYNKTIPVNENMFVKIPSLGFDNQTSEMKEKEVNERFVESAEHQFKSSTNELDTIIRNPEDRSTNEVNLTETCQGIPSDVSVESNNHESSCVENDEKTYKMDAVIECDNEVVETDKMDAVIECDNEVVETDTKQMMDENVVLAGVEKNEQVVQTSKSESTHKKENDQKDMWNDLYSAVILSPSERVKTNKRSCKKEPNPFQPVWVKQKRPRNKSGNVKNVSESNQKQIAGVVKDKEVTIPDSALENSPKITHDIRNEFGKDIPKALKRKLEIVKKFDDSKKRMQMN